MDRRRFLGVTALGGVSALMSKPVFAIAGESDPLVPKRPNVILIMADDIGYECFGCYGSTFYKTPSLDKLAVTGMRFDRCYSQPLCTPSRVEIMTGQYNFRNYVAFATLRPGERTFGNILKGAGYATCVVGKWQLLGRSKDGNEGVGPKETGFDEYCLWQLTHRGSRYADPEIEQNGGPLQVLRGKYGPDVFCDYARDFIRRHSDRPFFLYYPMVLSHEPYVPTPDSADWENNKGKHDIKYFKDMVSYIDKIVGRIVQKLDELGLRENTLILFTSDNGTGTTISSEFRGGVIKGGKGLTTDAGTHVPLIVNWKGVIPAGKACDDLVDFSDFVPTIASVAGVSSFQDVTVDGRSFLPQLLGERGNPRDWVFCHYDPKIEGGRFEPSRFVRDKRWKLYQDGRLFDVESDPLEGTPIRQSEKYRGADSARRRLQKVLDSMK